jgi:DNA-binding response OmpR family regulator
MRNAEDKERRTILIVDDDDDYRTALTRFLGLKGWICRTAASGAEAVALLDHEEFDLALVDCWMPGISGFETMHELRRKKARLPVVLISAMGTEATTIEAVRQGARAFISKGASPAAIAAEIENQIHAADAAEEEEDARGGILSKGTLLFVDDHDGYRRAAARILRADGFRVLDAASGVEALEACRAGGIDGAIIDLHLPDTTGIEVARVLKTICPTLAVVIISGEANHQERRAALEYGLTGCVNKHDSESRLVAVATLLVTEAERARQLEDEARRPPPPFADRLRDWSGRLTRQGWRLSRQAETRVVVVGLVIAALLAVVVLDGIARQELRRIDAASTGAEEIHSMQEMYARIVGYLERDEQRELEGNDRR